MEVFLNETELIVRSNDIYRVQIVKDNVHAIIEESERRMQMAFSKRNPESLKPLHRSRSEMRRQPYHPFTARSTMHTTKFKKSNNNGRTVNHSRMFRNQKREASATTDSEDDYTERNSADE